MEPQEYELSVGDVTQIEGFNVTIVDVDGDVVSFKINHDEYPMESFEWATRP